MNKLLRQCPKCSRFTLKQECPDCGSVTISPHPPKFSPQDRYARYRVKDRYVKSE
ncbi:MAG: RNA-protein complex protein Nop10 [Nitrososphaerales archaeon]